jgi:hypothetical protein
VEGRGLHAPIIERLIELPMDISAGRADGELRICSHDAASWHFPEFYGRVAVRCAPEGGLGWYYRPLSLPLGAGLAASLASPLPDMTLLCPCRGADFHFWDATDDITDADLDLLFERDRLYLHNARGSFGAVPMTLTGGAGLGS